MRFPSTITTRYIACNVCRGEGLVGRMSRRQRWTIEPCTGGCSGLGIVANNNAQPDAVALSNQPSSLTKPVDAENKGFVAIVGCGIGGAALALALSQRGVPVRVFERDVDFAARAQGYGLTMQQGALALARLGVVVPGTKSRAHHAYLPDGTQIGCYGREVYGLVENGAAPNIAPDVTSAKDVSLKDGALSHKSRQNIQLPRQRLRALLVRELDPSLIEWNKRLESFALEPPAEAGSRPTLRLTFDDGSQVGGARVIVGADGVYSNVRKQKFPNSMELEYLGLVVMLGIVNFDSDLLHARVTQTLDGVTRIFTMPFLSREDVLDESLDIGAYASKFSTWKGQQNQQDVTMWQLSFPCSLEEAQALQASGGEGLLREALKRCGEWHSPIPELLKACRPEDVTGYPVYDRMLTNLADDNQSAKWFREGEEPSEANLLVTLLGDAAHPMSPFKGQGANQALVDALNLARKVTKAWYGEATETDMPTALGEFEGEMLKRAGDKVEASRLAASFLHSKDALRPVNCVRSAASFKDYDKLTSKLNQTNE